MIPSYLVEEIAKCIPIAIPICMCTFTLPIMHANSIAITLYYYVPLYYSIRCMMHVIIDYNAIVLLYAYGSFGNQPSSIE